MILFSSHSKVGRRGREGFTRMGICGANLKAREGQRSRIWRQASGCHDGLCNLSPVKREVRAECGGVSSPEKDRWILGAIAGILEKAEKK